MPLLHNFEDDWVEPDDVDRPAVTYGARLTSHSQFELEPHRHAKGQFLLALRGMFSAEVEGCLWVVPARTGMWIPGGALHSFRVAGELEGYSTFLSPEAATHLPPRCCALAASPLLRELMVRAAELPLLYPLEGSAPRLVALLLDEIGAAPASHLQLPMPADERLRRIVSQLLSAPAERGTMQAWAKRARLSERSLARLVVRETGMSFGRWRQRLSVMLALQWLAKGAPIKEVAERLGYDSASSFVTMFRRAMGVAPGRYLAELGVR